MTLKVGCGRFPVARARYFETLPTVEVGPAFLEPPKAEVVANWRAEAPASFDFSLPASQLITHTEQSGSFAKSAGKLHPRRRPFCGHFRDSPEVGLAWEATRAAAVALKARFVLFETPATFYPDANHLRDMYRFFKHAARAGFTLVWEPRGRWEEKLVKKICGDLGLVRALDPFSEVEPGRGVQYYRVRAVDLSEPQLSTLRRLGREGQAYLYFTHRDGWLEARKLLTGRR